MHSLIGAIVMLACATFAAANDTGSTGTPAERRIAEARRAIDKLPERADGWNALAVALARRARETADTDFYVQADAALAKAAAIEPDNFETRKARVWVLLGRHEFARALEEAKALNKRMPDDVLVYGYLADAYVELGQYAEAEKAVQWMLDLRPGNVPGLTRASYLRELFGDVEGAIELMQAAYTRTAPTESEDRAWIATHLAHLDLLRGRTSEAAKLAEHALELFPGYHYALVQLAKVRMSEKRMDDAIALLRRFHAAAPHPENLYQLADGLAKAGHRAEARKHFAEFETKARAEMHGWDNANRELTLYYVDHARSPARALEVARAEAARRQDILTLDALAWALSAAGRHKDARAASERVIAVGTRDAAMLYRAAVVAQRAGDRRAAHDLYSRSLEANPRSEFAQGAQQGLARTRAAAGEATKQAVATR
jgi:tetratricopeptide (TPR) repeat protein